MLISHVSKFILKILQASLHHYVNWEFLDVQAGLKKVEEPEIKLPTFTASWRKQRDSRKTSTSTSLTMWKQYCVHDNKLWEILKEMGVPDHLTHLLRNLYSGQEVTELDMEQWTGFKLGKGNAVHCNPAYLTYMQSTSCEMPRWMKQTGIRIIGRGINNLRYADDTALSGRQWRGTKEPLDGGEREECKSWFKAQH